MVKLCQKTEKGTADVFENLLKNVSVSQYSDSNPVIAMVYDSAFEAILKYKKTCSILAIPPKCSKNDVFGFNEVNSEEIERKVGLLKLNKVSQFQLKLSRKTQIYFQKLFVRVLTIP